MKILILTCKFGMGHYVAAKAVQDKIVANYKDIKVGTVDLKDYCMRTPKKFVKDFWNEIKNFTYNIDKYIDKDMEYEIQESEYSNDENEVKIVDLFELAYPEFIDILYKAFSIAIDKGYKIYNFVYKKTENMQTSEQKALELVYSHILGSVGKLLLKEKPTVVISSFSICSEIISDYKKFSGSNIPLITVITDIIPHLSWLNEKTDYYLVATEETKKILMNNEVEENKICISGMPITKQFEDIKNIDTNKNMKLKNLLIMGGGLGLIPKDLHFYQKLNSVKGLKTTVVTGKNINMYNRLHGKFENVEVFGYCNDIKDKMMAADLLLSKSGGITTFESIYSKLPCAIFKPFLAQEVSNADYIRRNNLGIVLKSNMKNVSNDIDDILELVFDENKLNYLRDNMKKVLAKINENAIIELLNKIEEEQTTDKEKGNNLRLNKIHLEKN